VATPGENIMLISDMDCLLQAAYSAAQDEGKGDDFCCVNTHWMSYMEGLLFAVDEVPRSQQLLPEYVERHLSDSLKVLLPIRQAFWTLRLVPVETLMSDHGDTPRRRQQVEGVAAYLSSMSDGDRAACYLNEEWAATCPRSPHQEVADAVKSLRNAKYAFPEPIIVLDGKVIAGAANLYASHKLRRYAIPVLWGRSDGDSWLDPNGACEWPRYRGVKRKPSGE